jgi:hypothetical protein
MNKEQDIPNLFPVNLISRSSVQLISRSYIALGSSNLFINRPPGSAVRPISRSPNLLFTQSPDGSMAQ